MKRYLTYLMLVALSSSVLFTAQATPEALASNQPLPPATAKVQSTKPKDSHATQLAKAAPVLTPAAGAPSPPTFDPNNSTTWPKCPDTQFVRADTGLCADKPPAPTPASTPAPRAAVAVAASSDTSGGCGDNEYAHYIYMHESGCDTNRYNSIGCYGIGQACPASKISQCGASYSCQNEWFSAYAARTYGGWAGAYSFWLSHNWW